MKTNGRQWGWCVLAAMVLAGCAREGAPPVRVAQTEEALRDLSSVAVGRGFDRALDVDREDCFARDRASVTAVRLWEGTGFTLFTANELATKLRTAIQVGVKVEATEGNFGSPTALRIGPSGEESHFVMLARYTARNEDAGPIRAAAATCAQVASKSQNGVEDFVSTCGDRYLAHKVFGGHVLISWRRDTSRGAVDEVMGSMFGARTFGATLDPQVNLATLKAQGLGQEEVFIEAAGVPFGPTQVTLPSGNPGFSVESALSYLADLARANVGSFPRVVDYSMARYSVADIDSCLAFTGRQSALPEAEWACVYDRLTELADTRDGEGDLAHLRDRYEVHRLALTEQLSRVVFNTVPQSRCAVDTDGDPALEKSGPCQEQALRDFVKFFEACTVRSAEVLAECRNPVLADVLSCAAFEAKGCKLPQTTLSDGSVVTCDEAGVNAALADVIPYQVLPPFSPPPPPSTFVPPLVLQFGETGGPIQIPGVSTTTDLCGITAMSGGLHGSVAMLEAWSPDWMVWVQADSKDRDRQVSIEVTCVKFENFHHLNGGTHAFTESRLTSNIPAANGGPPHEQYLLDPGNPMLGGFWGYLDEPSTAMQVTNPDWTGFGKYVARDLFPFASTRPVLMAYSITANPPQSGQDPGGTLMDPNRSSGKAAFIELSNRLANNMSAPLKSNAFCYLVGVSGRYFNTSDSVRISTSDGFTTLSVSTPLFRDRNPGAIAQCALFDQY
ncbi:MAG: hypothetical protein Q8L48_43695 [Archangium sp.]|nr:hypothetical protein [Archangium sp.]